MSKEIVVLKKCTDYDIDKIVDNIEFMFKEMGGLSNIIKTKDRVLLKPNMIIGAKPERAATTHPLFIEAMIIVLKKHGIDNINLGDSPGTGQVTSDISAVCGYTSVCKKHNVAIIDLVKEFNLFDERCKFVKKFVIADEVHDFDVIVNLPKMKTHGLSMMTGAVKNYYGLMPGKHKHLYHFKMQNHLDFSEMLLDFHDSIKRIVKTINFMDGIIGMEGAGPTAGSPKKYGVMLASKNAIALDTVVGELMGIRNVTTTLVARKRGIPEARINNVEVIGGIIDELKVKGLRKQFSFIGMLPKFMFGFPKKIILSSPYVVPHMCISCGKCADVCPVTAIEMQEKKFKDKTKKIPVFDYNKCIRCYCCQEVCPAKAIKLKKPFLRKLVYNDID